MNLKLISVVVAVFACMLTAQGQTKHRIVVEVCTAGTVGYGATLNNVENLKKAFGADNVEVEIVCHGSGIDLLFSNKNSLAARVEKLQKVGVRFSACGNTLKARKIAKNRIFPFVRVVDSGTAEVVRKQEAGWSYLRR